MGRAKTGTFLGIPYDWRRPTLARVRERMWSPEERRLWMPHAFGWGYTLNLYEALRRLRVVARRR